MIEIITYLILFGIIVLIGQLFSKFAVPVALLLVITGMLLSLIPHFFSIELNPKLVLDIFLPILIYQISAFASWQDFKKNIRPISSLSVGHVIFMTALVAAVVMLLTPQLGWPLALVIGAIISPPDDVAIVSIAEKVRLPNRVVTILEGEGMLNDAAALMLFRLALAAVITHQFLISHAILTFTLDIILEAIYGLVLGYIIGELRLKITNPSLHIIASLLTPFFAYLPAEILGGTGIVATVVTGFVIGNVYSTRFTPEFRLISRGIWPGIAFSIQSLLFLLVGLDMLSIMQRISAVPVLHLVLYATTVIVTVIVGRFAWVYFFVIFLPHVLFSPSRRREHIFWQYPFLVAWAGMRGSISLAAALSVPVLPVLANGIAPKDLLIFLVFSVIVATLVLQGLALPWLVKIIGIEKIAQCEQYNEHIQELMTRKRMIAATLHWLVKYRDQIKHDTVSLEEVDFYIQRYRMQKIQLKTRIIQHDGKTYHDEQAEIEEETSLLLRIIEIERSKLMQLWREEKINLTVRNKLMDRLDHRAKHLTE